MVVVVVVVGPVEEVAVEDVLGVLVDVVEIGSVVGGGAVVDVVVSEGVVTVVVEELVLGTDAVEVVLLVVGDVVLLVVFGFGTASAKNVLASMVPRPVTMSYPGSAA
jgi:hypothetical protein